MQKTHNLLCDESNDKGDQVKLLTILLRIFAFEPLNSIVVTRHLDTIVDLFAEGIFNSPEQVVNFTLGLTKPPYKANFW